MSPAHPEPSAALALLSAKAVRDRAHRMLAIGLDDRLPNFRIDLDRWPARSIWCSTRRATRIHRSKFPFTRAGGTSSPVATIAGPPLLAEPASLSRQRVPAPNSTWPSSASSSMLASVIVALPRSGTGQPSAVGRIGAGQPRHVHGRRLSAAPSEPLRAETDKLAKLDVAVSRAACRSRTSIRWLDWTPVDLLRRLGHLVASQPDIFGGRDTPRPGGPLRPARDAG